ncbi:MAG: alpha/beta hydrolase fold domain-containing protein [Chitinophagales bacterium]|nr:alpha/beta hydrolase fold domain-containing protein [Chitinophagales bacterium]
MKMKHFILKFTCVAIIVATNAFFSFAQCPKFGRLYDKIYQIDSFEVTYTTVRQNYNKMDVFVPKGDNATRRPLLVMAHGGGFTAGNKNTDPAVNYLCKSFAQRGFVTASIQYRLTSAFNLIDSIIMMRTVLYAIHDAKAAVRFFVKDAATQNQYKVDSNYIFLGGSSAGAVLSIHYAYLDDIDEVPAPLKDTVIANGGIEGNSGNPGHSSAVKAIIPLAGGINKTWWIGANEEPALLVHGDKDRTVPYYFDQVYRLPPYNAFTLVTLFGSGSIDTALTNRGIPHQLKTYFNYDHTPWDTSFALRVEIDSIAREFIYPMICNNFPLSTDEKIDFAFLNLYSGNNPGEIFVESSLAQISSFEAYDISGRKIQEIIFEYPNNIQRINTQEWPEGFYVFKFFTHDNLPIATKKVWLSK